MSGYLAGLRCRECDARHLAEAMSACDRCFGPLEPVYDLDRLRAEMTRAEIEAGPRSLTVSATIEPKLGALSEAISVKRYPARTLSVGRSTVDGHRRPP